MHMLKKIINFLAFSMLCRNVRKYLLRNHNVHTFSFFWYGCMPLRVILIMCGQTYMDVTILYDMYMLMARRQDSYSNGLQDEDASPTSA